MNKKRSKKTGRFTSTQVRDPVAAAKEYYLQHKKSLDRLIPDIPGISKEKQFVDRFKYGISGRGITKRSNTRKEFLEKVKYVKAHLQGFNLDALEAKETAANGEKYGFGDRRKLSLKKFDLKQQLTPHYINNGKDPSDPDYAEVDGYFEIAGSDVVIARVYKKNEWSEDSPEAHYQFFKRSEIGL